MAFGFGRWLLALRIAFVSSIFFCRRQLIIQHRRREIIEPTASAVGFNLSRGKPQRGDTFALSVG
jgi:hypothetical protein